ncbi:hypothetical protein AC1031_009498 [Aphanomyces cochlioides]|nr:hypothetical protein AC1031_009498 [Aphanomyces cochlioides]
MWSSQYSEDDEESRVEISQDVIQDEDVEKDPGLHVVAEEGIAEEMKAMKEVFLRMSEKKVRQKEQSQQDCVRVYVEAFQSDIERLFSNAKKSRVGEAEKVNRSIQTAASRLEEQKKELLEVHETYESNFKASIEKVQSELERLKELRAKIVSAYEQGKEEIQKAFDEAFANLDTVTKRLQHQATQIGGDVSYLQAFHEQVNRLM